jgi:uncharacterized membrane protein YcaP (DUF421 family)
MWRLTIPWWESVLRGLIIYAFLLVALRLTGKRQIGQLAPFDLVLFENDRIRYSDLSRISTLVAASLRVLAISMQSN